MTYSYQFPRYGKDIGCERQLDKIQSEVTEAVREQARCDCFNLSVELLDVIHATETELRHLEGNGVSLSEAYDYVISKNEDRDYYKGE